MVIVVDTMFGSINFKQLLKNYSILLSIARIKQPNGQISELC